LGRGDIHLANVDQRKKVWQFGSKTARIFKLRWSQAQRTQATDFQKTTLETVLNEKRKDQELYVKASDQTARYMFALCQQLAGGLGAKRQKLDPNVFRQQDDNLDEVGRQVLYEPNKTKISRSPDNEFDLKKRQQ